MNNMVWRVGIGVRIRMVFMVLDLPCFVRTRHGVQKLHWSLITFPPITKNADCPHVSGWEFPTSSPETTLPEHIHKVKERNGLIGHIPEQVS